MAEAPYDPFNVAAIIPDFEAQFAEFKPASNATPGTLSGHSSTFPTARCRATASTCSSRRGDAAKRPIHIFIHGGYWRGQVKDDYAFVAEGIIAAGAICAMVEYTLMPGARMAQLVQRSPHGGSRGSWTTRPTSAATPPASRPAAIPPARTSVPTSAHVRPHETTFPAAPVRSLLLLGGLYNLRPIATSYLQPTLQLTPEEIDH